MYKFVNISRYRRIHYDDITKYSLLLFGEKTRDNL